MNDNQEKIKIALKHHNLKQYEYAEKLYKEILNVDPKNSDVLHLLGILLSQAKNNHNIALELIQKAISIKSNDLYYSSKGIVLRKLGNYEDALASYDKSIELNGHNADVYFNRGILHKELEQYDKALMDYDKAINLNSLYLEAYTNKGNILKNLKLYDKALLTYDIAIRINPNYTEAYVNKGIVFRELNQFNEAIKWYQKAIAINPNYIEAYYNCANAYRENNELEEASEYYSTVIKLNSDYKEAYFNKSLTLLLAGKLLEGFELYERRFDMNDIGLELRSFSKPKLTSIEAIKGKKIFIYSEQGLGDTIQFCRYIEKIANLGGIVIFELDKALIPLLKQFTFVEKFLARGEIIPDFDFHCSLMSLPFVFKTTLENIPTSIKYLYAEDKKTNYWKNKLSFIKGLKIGIVWNGNSLHKNDQNRSISLELMSSFLPVEHYYISIQKEIREQDKKTLKEYPNIFFFGYMLDDFSDTAALCDALDIIITVDTSVAHLAGALGKKTILLLSYVPDWRWLTHREDTPWYPSIKLVRQDDVNNWESCFLKLNEIIKEFEEI